MKLKQLKDKPLLEPPKGGVEVWRSFSDEDLKATVAYLDERREEKHWIDAAIVLAHLEGLGHHVMTQQDVRGMKAKLMESRKTDYGKDIMELHLCMRELGIPQKVTPTDTAAMKKMLRIDRDQKLNTPGSLLAKTLYQMKMLGVQVEVTGGDMRKILEYWGRALEYPGVSTMWMALALKLCHEMRELGIPAELTARHIDETKLALERARKATRTGDIAEILYYMNKLKPIPEDDTQQMPPLKEFVK